VKARLLEWRELAPGTRHFDFEAIDWDGVFVPGQFLSLTATIGSDPITRAYSIATPPAGQRFGLCANLVSDGRLSPWLFALRPGDEVEFKGPYGAFILRAPASEALFVATGTGIAPFRSMLVAALKHDPDRRLTLVFGVRHRQGLLYDEDFLALAREYPNFRYRPTLTRPDAEWRGATGRVQARVFEELGERRDVEVYICGLREMVDDLRAQLKAAGVDRKKIIYEKYD